MKRVSTSIGLVTVLFLAMSADSARATFHLWKIVEVYSSPDGSVQFVEFFTTSNSQHVANSINRRFESDDNTYVFTTNLSTALTANKTFLIGTTSYAALPGVPAPDYTVVDNFFDITGDMLDLLENSAVPVIDSFTFSGAQLPVDGTNSLNRAFLNNALSTALNSPKNFAGQTGTVVLPTDVPGDTDGDGDVDLDDFDILTANYDSAVGGGASDGDFNEDGMVDFDDFVIQALNFASTPGDTVALLPEPATAALLILFASAVCRRPGRRF